MPVEDPLAAAAEVMLLLLLAGGFAGLFWLGLATANYHG